MDALQEQWIDNPFIRGVIPCQFKGLRFTVKGSKDKADLDVGVHKGSMGKGSKDRTRSREAERMSCGKFRFFFITQNFAGFLIGLIN